MYQDFFNKQDDYLDEFKQKVAKQKIATMEERRSEIARSRNNFLGTFAGIMLAGIVGWFVLAPQYKQNNEDVPLITRPQAAVKIKPDNPGGMDIPNQDKDVYNIVEKKNVDNTVVENLLPSPETPKLPDIVPEITDIDADAANLDEIVDNVAAADAESTDAKSEVATNKTNAIPAKADDIFADEKNTPAGNPKAAENTKATDNTKAAENKVEAPAANGAWQIQLLASKNKDAASKAWNNLTTKYDLLKSLNHEIQEADLGAQGKIYKLRAGAFADKAAAQAFCAKLKTKGLNDCIAKER